LFDCDGVILDSNAIKTKAFYDLAIAYGKAAAERLVAYHQHNGGISRFRKIEYLYNEILGQKDPQDQVAGSVAQYGRLVFEALLACPLTHACEDFLRRLPPESVKIVVSGGLETELRDVFKRRGLAQYFHAIYGSPRSKEEILSAEVAGGRILTPAVFFGDSRYDQHVAGLFGFDFVFMSRYSEVTDPGGITSGTHVDVVRDFSLLASS